MILVIDSGAGGKAIQTILNAEGYDVELCADIDNFPYGNKTNDFLSARVHELISQYDNIHLVIIACNTASLCIHETTKILRIVPAPSEDDILLGSELTSNVCGGIDLSNLIFYIQGLYLGNMEIDEFRKLASHELSVIPKDSSVYLGCTHFSFVSSILKELRPDVIFNEPDYLTLTRNAINNWSEND